MSRECCLALPHGPRVCLQFVIVVFPDQSHLLFFRPGYVQTSLLSYNYKLEYCKFVCGNYSYRTFLTETNIAVDQTATLFFRLHATK